MQHVSPLSHPAPLASTWRPLSAFGATTARPPARTESFVVADVKGTLLVRQSDDYPDEHPILDSYGAPQGTLLSVAERMSSAEAMTRCLADCVPVLDRLDGRPDHELLGHLRGAHERARGIASQEAEPQVPAPEVPSMTTAFVRAQTLYVTHIGSSRCFLLRDRLMYQLTGNHGSDIKVSAEVRCVRLREGDRLLLCTQGLPSFLDTSDIAYQLHQAETVRLACEVLMQLSQTSDALADVTVVAAQF